MSIELIAIDLDDTLLDSRLRISESCRYALGRARDAGVKITLATGRMYRSARPYALELEMEVPLITYQGALVKTAISNEAIYYQPVPSNLALEVVKAARAYGYHYQTYLDDSLYMERLSPEGIIYSKLAGVEPVIEPDLPRRIAEEEPTKIIIVQNQFELMQRLEEDLKKEFDGLLYITRSKPNYLEVMNLRATKASGLKAVSEYLGIDRTSIMALGDSYNDIDMLQWAGIGVAVGNAPKEVQEAADFVTASNDEDGVAKAVSRFLKID